jgi:hypothetical protein
MGFDVTIQMIASTLAESLREEFSGQISSMFKGSQSDFTFQNYMDKRLTVGNQYPTGQELILYFNEYKAELIAAQDMRYDSNTKRYYCEFLGVLGTSLKLFATVISAYSMFSLFSNIIKSGSTSFLKNGVEIPVIWLTKYLKDKGWNHDSLTDEQKATIRKVYESANKKNTVWFEKDGRRIIEDIVQRTTQSNSKIGDKIQLAINDFMRKLESEKPYKPFIIDEIIKDEKGREFISFNDPDFQFALEKIKINPSAYGGLIYVVEVMGIYYCGLTERTIDIRFEEHIIDALRGYISSGGDVNKPGYTKFYDSICTILKICYGDIIKLYRELQTYSALGRVNDRQKKIEEIKSVIKPFIKKHIIEIHYGVNSLGKRETQLIKKFPYKTLFEEGILEMGFYDMNGPDIMDLKARGLNTIAGGTGC